MFEMEGSGIGSYYNRMFKLLKMVSEKASPRFDAWYQFSVANPLRFLGLIDNSNPDDTDKTISAEGKKKLDNHLQYIEKCLGDTKFKEDAGLKKEKNIKELKKRAYDNKSILYDNIRLKNCEEIKDADNLSDPNKLLILRDPKDKIREDEV